MAREFLPQRQEAVTIGEKCAFRSLNSGFGRRLLIFAPWTVVVRGFFNLKKERFAYEGNVKETPGRGQGPARRYPQGGFLPESAD